MYSTRVYAAAAAATACCRNRLLGHLTARRHGKVLLNTGSVNNGTGAKNVEGRHSRFPFFFPLFSHTVRTRPRPRAHAHAHTSIQTRIHLQCVPLASAFSYSTDPSAHVSGFPQSFLDCITNFNPNLTLARVTIYERNIGAKKGNPQVNRLRGRRMALLLFGVPLTFASNPVGWPQAAGMADTNIHFFNNTFLAFSTHDFAPNNTG